MPGPNLQQITDSVARILILLLYISTYLTTSGYAGNGHKKVGNN